MKKLPVLILFLVHWACLSGQVTLVIDQVPAYYTPLNGVVYVAGDFNNWDAAGQALTQQANGTYTTVVNATPGSTIAYKYTRGTWPQVETQADGSFLANRSITVSAGQTVHDTVLNWEDFNGTHSAVGNTHILDLDFPMPSLNTNRRVWIYLPQDYYTSNQAYPVLYMHDGQNLFDALYSFAGEWEVDESMENLQNAGGIPLIVVGIDNGGVNRTNEYSAWTHPQYGGGDGDLYLDFLVNTLKPAIDQQFRTRPGRETTGIMGSSMGGLISHYAALERPDVFGKAGLFSSSLWFSDSVYTHTSSKGHNLPMRMYMIAGDLEGGNMVGDMRAMEDTLLQAGFSPSELFVTSHPDGQHSEWYWARELSAAVTWLFSDVLLTQESPQPSVWRLKSKEGIYSVVGPENKRVKLRVFDINGRVIFQKKVSNGQVFLLPKLGTGVGVAIFEDGLDTTQQKINFQSF